MMLNPWYSAMLLAFEAGDVLRLRTLKISSGGADAYAEVHLMVTEKIVAAVEVLGSIVLDGMMPMSVIERYRDLVAANACRLRS